MLDTSAWDDFAWQMCLQGIRTYAELQSEVRRRYHKIVVVCDGPWRFLQRIRTERHMDTLKGNNRKKARKRAGRNMNREYLWKDPVFSPEEPQPDHQSILIPGRRGKLLSLLYRTGGKGPHPAVLMCHGFPGNEQNLDIAQALRRLGFHTMSFHYSGSWGSDGEYSFSHCLEDAETILDYMLTHPETGIDPDAVYIFGHSLGGFVAANLLAGRQELKAGVLMSPADLCHTCERGLADPELYPVLEASLEDSAAWLRGTNASLLAEDLQNMIAEHRFLSLADALSRKDLLMLTAANDTATPFQYDQKPLLEALDRLGGKKYRHLHFQTGHGYENARIAATEVIADYLLQHVTKDEM